MSQKFSSFLQTLPFELLMGIFRHLDNDATCNLMLTCHSFHQLIAPSLWSNVVFDFQALYRASTTKKDKHPVPAPYQQQYLHGGVTPGLLTHYNMAEYPKQMKINAANFHEVCAAVVCQHPMGERLASTKTLTVLLPMYSQEDQPKFECKTNDDILRVHQAPHYLVYWFVTKAIPVKFVNLSKIHVIMVVPPAKSFTPRSVKSTMLSTLFSKLPDSVERSAAVSVDVLSKPRQIICNVVQYQVTYLRLDCHLVSSTKSHKTIDNVCGCLPLPQSVERLDLRAKTGAAGVETRIEAAFLAKLLNSGGATGGPSRLHTLYMLGVYVRNEHAAPNWLPPSVTALALSSCTTYYITELPAEWLCSMKAFQNIRHLAVDACSSQSMANLAELLPSKLEAVHMPWADCEFMANLPRVGHHGGAIALYVAAAMDLAPLLDLCAESQRVDKLYVAIDNDTLMGPEPEPEPAAATATPTRGVPAPLRKFTQLHIYNKGDKPFGDAVLARLRAYCHQLVVDLPAAVAPPSSGQRVGNPASTMGNCFWIDPAPNRDLYIL